ncbi:CIS tube protein [Fulvivirga sediminis]|uniref:LysM peptidoglycan-binding domain-containing protein n=1 Tax=Fulvivirga sediminis TaxID=2803949 RepID=A0A937JZQ8_9BACT|nr:LysM peptidoglycan-binding domain-containing protein [Fulvivirga sediminis]MBL3655540.1 LysM peptidoglycan-binding domain-containing protein [Fulvivirga sediminis]
MIESLNLFNLEKLKINSYQSTARRGRHDTFYVMFNPESYSLRYENLYSKDQAINASGRQANYALSKPEELKLKIILDNTGVSNYGLDVLGSTSKDVYKEVKRFLELTTLMDGQIHEPKCLTILWGDLNFKCRLKSLDINYSLFDSSGVPLRAELDTSFFGDLDESERLKKENKSSPDLTHTRVVKAGDQLPRMCQEIYGSAGYYLYVAKANGLKDFRNIPVGKEIFFPPIEK